MKIDDVLGLYTFSHFNSKSDLEVYQYFEAKITSIKLMEMQVLFLKRTIEVYYGSLISLLEKTTLTDSQIKRMMIILHYWESEYSRYLEENIPNLFKNETNTLRKMYLKKKTELFSEISKFSLETSSQFNKLIGNTKNLMNNPIESFQAKAYKYIIFGESFDRNSVLKDENVFSQTTYF